MTRRGLFTWAGLAIAVLGAVAATTHFASGLTRGAGERALARRADLVLEVEVSGLLRADDSVQLGPPSIAGVWRYKIERLAVEGVEVRAGDEVVSFDASELAHELEEKRAEMESAVKEIERERISLELDLRDDRLKTEEVAARLRKADLKLEVPAVVVGAHELAKTRLDRELAQGEFAHVSERMQARARSGEAHLEYYRGKRAHAERAVSELEAAIEKLSVKATRDGIVVHIVDERGQKKKAGDACWVGEKVVEIPDLAQMHAEAEVAEIEAGRVRAGQAVRLRLDAYPDVEFEGRVETLYGVVRRQSPDLPLKVARADVALAQSDPARMRPGMRFRGQVETDRALAVLQVPVEAVFAMPEGPVVYRRDLGRWLRTPIVAGRRNRHSVEVISGLAEGAEVTTVEPKGRS